MTRKLSSYEKETIINFNEAEPIAYIFTYNKAWQKHLEDKLGLKPTLDNGFGGKEYQIDKKRIKPPRAKRQLSAEAKAKLARHLRQNHNLASKNATVQAKSEDKS